MIKINPFPYIPTNEYDFSIIPNSNTKTLKPTNHKNIYANIELNYKHIQTIYNALINSDIVIRNFTLLCQNKQYKAFIVYIDGMVNTELINRFILDPLMLRNQSNTFNKSTPSEPSYEAQDDHISVKKIKNFDLEQYIYQNLLPQNSLEKSQEFTEIFDGINSGNCALFVDTISTAFDIDVKGLKQRNVDKPSNENIIKGPQEAFVENIRNNTALLRRIINSEELIIESTSLGDITKTKAAICYLKDIANDNLVAEVKFRLNSLKVNSLLSTGQLEQLIEDNDKMRNSSTFINRKTR